MWTWLHLPGGLVQHGFHLVYLISTKVDHSEMNPAVQLDANFSEPEKEKKNTHTHTEGGITQIKTC